MVFNKIVRVLIWCGLLAVTGSVFAAGESARPNIIFIIADDLGYGEIGCYGQDKIKTPNIDQLAKEGMRFTNYYSSHPLCSASRGSLMTGKHLGHSSIQGQGGKLSDFFKARWKFNTPN